MMQDIRKRNADVLASLDKVFVVEVQTEIGNIAMVPPPLSRIRRYLRDLDTLANDPDSKPDDQIDTAMIFLGECIGANADEADRVFDLCMRTGGPTDSPLMKQLQAFCGGKISTVNGSGDVIGYDPEQNKEADAQAPFVE